VEHHSTVMADLLRVIPRHRIEKIIAEGGTDYRIRRLSTFQLLTAMLYGQITRAFSIREIEHGLHTQRDRLYHSGMVPVKRSTLSDAMSKRDCAVFERIYHELVAIAVQRSSVCSRRFKSPLRAIDSTTIPLSIERFDWAKFRKAKGAVKLHVSYDIEDQLPVQAICTHASVHDCPVLPRFDQAGSIIVIDRGYLAFNRLYQKELRGERYVTRLKHNINFKILRPHSDPTEEGVLGDWVVKLDNPRRRIDYPHPVRVVEYEDPATGKRFRFLTNVWDLSAYDIAEMYKARWQVELFFKWIKQNLKIKAFWGTGKNAVFMQIWTALILYVLIWIQRSILTIDCSLQRLSQMIRLAVFQRRQIADLVHRREPPPGSTQPSLWDAVPS